VVTLGLGIPLLVISTVLYRRGLLRGGLLLLGTLAWFLYVGVSYALGSVAYNEMFLAYVALFAASLYAFVLAFASVDLEALAVRFSPRMPRRSPGIFMLVSGVVVFAIWLMAPVTSLMTGKPPDRLDIYTTLFTLANALDMAVIAPASILAGLLILRQTALGYLIALALLVLEAMLAPMIAAQMVSQLSAGVELTPG
jgi:hypothetical protein